jgi:hypothetical protein
MSHQPINTCLSIIIKHKHNSVSFHRLFVTHAQEKASLNSFQWTHTVIYQLLLGMENQSQINEKLKH